MKKLNGLNEDDDFGGASGGLTDWLNDSATLQDETGELSDGYGSGLTDILNDPDPLLDSDLFEAKQEWRARTSR